jgi:hypothetical protein
MTKEDREKAIKALEQEIKALKGYSVEFDKAFSERFGMPLVESAFRLDVRKEKTSTVDMTDTLLEHGINPKDLLLVGKFWDFEMLQRVDVVSMRLRDRNVHCSYLQHKEKIKAGKATLTIDQRPSVSLVRVEGKDLSTDAWGLCAKTLVETLIKRIR